MEPAEFSALLSEMAVNPSAQHNNQMTWHHTPAQDSNPERDFFLKCTVGLYSLRAGEVRLSKDWGWDSADLCHLLTCLSLLLAEQRDALGGDAVDQPPRDGVAALRGSGRVRAQPAGQRRARRADGELRGLPPFYGEKKMAGNH